MRRLRLTLLLLLVSAWAMAQNPIDYKPPAGFAGGTITSPILAPSGTASAPSYAFSADPDTGMFLGNTGQLDLDTAGTTRASFSSLNAQFSIPIWTPDGAATSPTHSFVNFGTSGLFRDSVTNGLGLSADGAARMLIAGSQKTLTDNSATTFVRVAVEADSTTFIHVDYSVEAENATDQQVVGGTAHVGIINDAGTETCSTITEVGEQTITSVGTITFTMTCSTAPTNAVDLQATSDTSLNVSPKMSYTIRKNGGIGAITPQ